MDSKKNVRDLLLSVVGEQEDVFDAERYVHVNFKNEYGDEEELCSLYMRDDPHCCGAVLLGSFRYHPKMMEHLGVREEWVAQELRRAIFSSGRTYAYGNIIGGDSDHMKLLNALALTGPVDVCRGVRSLGTGNVLIPFIVYNREPRRAAQTGEYRRKPQ